MTDVARRSGVSVGTVSNVLHRTAPVSEETRRRVLTAIDELGYRQNEVARSLRRRATRTLGVVIPDALNPFHATVALQVERQCCCWCRGRSRRPRNRHVRREVMPSGQDLLGRAADDCAAI